MHVSEVMTRDVILASPDDALQHAAQLMTGADCGVLPVEENDRLVGMLTDRDITVRAVARGMAPGQCQVRDIMSPAIMYVYEDDAVENAVQSMSELKVRRLPVVNCKKRLVGIVSLGDIAAKRPEGAAEALHHISRSRRAA